jgi:phosphoglycerate dehydrogenase-like enzyme
VASMRDETIASAAPLIAVYTDWGDIDIAPGARALEDAGWEVRRLGSTDVESIARVAADATALCLGYAPAGRELLRRLGRLRIVATLSAGYDMVDIDAATERGVWVANIPDAAVDEVAGHALAMALALIRHLTWADREVRTGGWKLDVASPPRAPSALTFGVLGLGRIGRRAAELARGVFGGVMAHDPRVPADQWPAGVGRLSRDELVARADVLSLHLALTPESQRIVDAELIARMPPGAFLVNVSRGGLVDHASLLAALDAGHLAGAGLDVLDVEPPPFDHPAIRHPRVLVTPHTAFLSDRSLDLYPRRQAENVLVWQRTGRPLSPVRELS